jgi:hypothetical protein
MTPFVTRRWPTERDPHNHQVQWRTEPDPHCPVWRWRVVNGVRECRLDGFVTWHRQPAGWAWSMFDETPERVSLWVELTLVPVEV